MRIVITDSNLEPFREKIDTTLIGDDVRWHNSANTPEAMRDMIDAEVIVGPSLTAEIAHLVNSLRLVQVAGVGTDGIALDALPTGVTCANVAGHEASMAEYIVSTAVLVRRRLAQQDAALRHGHWLSSTYDNSVPLLPSLGETAIGIVGYGGIGSAAWKAFQALGAREGRAIRRSPSGAQKDGLKWLGGFDRLDELIAASDVVVIAIPHTAQTNGIISEHELGLFGPDGVLVNVARGPVVDEKALFHALRSNRIGGAVIDVWWNYPPAPGIDTMPSSYPFAELNNVFLTPHVSGTTQGTFARRVNQILDNIQSVRSGKPLRNVVRGQA